MEFTAVSKNVRISPRKVRAVANAVKKLPLSSALDKLSFLAKSASQPILKTLKSALANAQNADGLQIKNIIIDEGVKMKRRDTSHRASRDSGTIQKRASHIKVILTDGK